MTREPLYDLVILGGGTGGLVSAFVAAGVGARVALVERDEHPGGDCLWTGCVPSKSLLAAAELAHGIRSAAAFGLEATLADVDLGAVMAHVREVQAQIAPHDSAARLRDAGVEVVRGSARLAAGRTVTVGDRRLRARKVIIATGSHPALPAVDGLAQAGALTTDTVWELDVLPERLVVLGAGPIGCELGQAFARLGSRVTLVEAAEQVLPKEDEDVSALLLGALSREGVSMRLGTTIASAQRLPGGGVRLTPTAGEPLDADRVLVATGRTPRTSRLGLAAAGVRTDDRGAIVVDRALRTSARHVLAVGDVTGGPAFTHVAAHHARVATVNALFGLRRRADTAVVPRVTFTDPEVAQVGLTVTQARARWGDDVVLARTGEHAELDRARTARAGTGQATLVADPKGRLVGASVVGRAAGEAVAELTAWITTGAKIDAVSTTVHAYPTYAEIGARAADEHLRARYATPRVRALLRPVLAAARLLPRRR